MSILDQEITGREPDVTDGARRIKRLIKDIVHGSAGNLANINNIIDKYGKNELVAELGDDAAEVTAIYRTCRTFINGISALDVPDIQ